jgi:N-acetylglutamate synthase-like GNAT family acetyltransferase
MREGPSAARSLSFCGAMAKSKIQRAVRSGEHRIRSMEASDLAAVAALIRARGLAKGKDLRERLAVLAKAETADCFVAEGEGGLIGVVLSSFNGFHVFVSHIAVAEELERHGVGAALLEAVIARATARRAVGLVVDSRLTSTTFFFRHGFRLPGAVLMIRDL